MERWKKSVITSISRQAFSDTSPSVSLSSFYGCCWSCYHSLVSHSLFSFFSFFFFLFFFFFFCTLSLPLVCTFSVCNSNNLCLNAGCCADVSLDSAAPEFHCVEWVDLLACDRVVRSYRKRDLIGWPDLEVSVSRTSEGERWKGE